VEEKSKPESTQNLMSKFIPLSEKNFIPHTQSLDPDAPFFVRDGNMLSVWAPGTVPYHSYDMVDGLADILEGFNGSRILVCPLCSRDVELVLVSYPGTPDAVLLMERKEHIDLPNLAVCAFCKMEFFILELIKHKSFRLRLESDKESFLYAKLEGA